jgi:integrase
MGEKPTDFLEFMKERIEAQIDESSIGTTDKRSVVLNKLVEFCHGKALYFDEVTIRFIRDFQAYLKDQRGNHTNTIHSNLKVIRKMLEEAISENLMPFEKNPFNRIRLKSQKTFREFLLDDELAKIEDLQLTTGSMIEHHRNLYVFSAYTGGIRISDLLMMRWRNFTGEHLYFQIRKTQDELRIRLPEQSMQIINHYKAIAAQRQGVIHPDTFIFPLIKLSPKEKDRRVIHRAISSATAYTNKNLSKISALAGIIKHLSFHTARHSWAVRALQKGMRIEYVSKLMGHASVKQTEIYAKILNAELDKAMGIFNMK